MEELTQSLENKKILGEFDRDAATSVTDCTGVTKSLICQIHAQTVASLRNYPWRVLEPVNACFSQESNLVVLHPPTDSSAKK